MPDYVTVLVAGELHLAPVTQVREILPMVELMKAPEGDEGCLGLLNLRGDLVAVYPASRDAGAPGVGDYILVFEGDPPRGVVVQDVQDVVTHDAADLRSTGKGPGARVMIQTGAGLVSVLDPPAGP